MFSRLTTFSLFPVYNLDPSSRSLFVFLFLSALIRIGAYRVEGSWTFGISRACVTRVYVCIDRRLVAPYERVCDL